MEYYMRLLEEPFELMKTGKKSIEVRLNDEKRQKLDIGDVIIFRKLPDCNERLKVKVVKLLNYRSFKKLYEDLCLCHFGIEGDSISKILNEIYNIYSKEDEEKHGVLGISVEII
ncbi:MAG: ASCH domain-containing protein [Fusobacteriota bacterium]